MSGRLILVRHGQSEWNILGQWTGLTDVDITKIGEEEATKAGQAINDINIDYAFTSALKRAQRTLDIILSTINQSDIKYTVSKDLNERDYGDLTGKNKWQVKEEHGDELFNKWRRSWDHQVPGGETLKDVSNRVLPYYNKNIMPLLKNNKTVIVVAHGNSLRSLIKHLDNIPDNQASSVEMQTGEVLLYNINSKGLATKKEVRVANKTKL